MVEKLIFRSKLIANAFSSPRKGELNTSSMPRWGWICTAGMKTTINQILFTQNTKHDILANAIIPDFKHQIQFSILNQDRKISNSRIRRKVKIIFQKVRLRISL